MRLVPKDEIGFGSVLVGETKVLYLTIENAGPFDFAYKVISKADLEHIMENLQKEEAEGGAVHGSGSAQLSFLEQDRFTNASKSPETRGKKQQPPDKKVVGPFTVYNLSGLVKRDQSVKVKITCSPEKEFNFKEVILVQASELPEALRFGLPVSLVATGCAPSVDFSNTAVIYRDAIILPDSKSLYDNNGLPAVVYRQDTNGGVEFHNVVVSVSHSLKMYLHNTGMVPATIRLRLVSLGSVRPEYFTVFPYTLHLPAYSTDSFTLTFTPASNEVSEAVLEMELDAPYGKCHISSVKVSGRGCLPLVELISPIQVKSCVKSDKSLIDLGTCLVDFHISNILTFKNTGSCHCKFILELATELEINCFTLAALPHCKDLVASLDDGKNERLSCGVGPGKELQLSCVFAPVTAALFVSSIKVLIVDNPYEQYRILLCGKGHMDSVTIEGLPFLFEPINTSALNLKLTGKPMPKSQGGASSTYLMDLGAEHVGRPVKEELTLRNHSDSWARFLWDLGSTAASLGVALYPRLGVLPPRASTLVYAVYLPPAPVKHTKLSVRCYIEKVVLEDSCFRQWNCHEKLVAWLKHESKYLQRFDVYCNIMENEDEPSYTEVTKMCELKLLIELGADKPSVTSDVSYIAFPDTLICQGNSSSVTLKNTSRVEVRLSCQVRVTKAVPSQVALEPVFSVGRLSGTVYPTACLPHETGLALDSASSKTSKTKSSLSVRWDVDSTRASARSESSGAKDWECRRKQEPTSPFSVSPSSIVLPPGDSASLLITFLPPHMFTYSARAIFLLEGLEENLCPGVDIEATGLASYCHLDIESSDFSLTAEYPEGTKTIIVDSIGLPASYNKAFSVTNPTDREYHFQWIKSDKTQDMAGISELQCLTPSGLIRPRKTFDMEFSFFSIEEGKFESLWHLRIIEMDMELSLLFVSTVRQPQVKFACSGISLGPTIAGAPALGEAVLENEEDTELKFKVDKCSLFSEGRYEKLDIEPLSGTLPPLSSKLLRLIFTPKSAGEVNFSVAVQVSKRKESLKLRVGTCCFSVEAVVTLCPEGLSQPLTLSPGVSTSIPLGHMELKVPRSMELSILNTGRAGFYTEISRKDEIAWKRSCVKLAFDSKPGFIPPGKKLSVDLVFSATAKASFHNLPLTIKVIKGPEYNVLFTGEAAAPQFNFNFLHYEFGPRFVQTSNEPYNTADLIFRNEDEVSLEIEKIFKDGEVFKVDLEYSVVPPRSALTIVVKFFPRQASTYSADIEFLINGIYSTLIHFSGTGVPFKVELQRTKDKLIDFGPVPVGQTVCRPVELINRSTRSATVRLVAGSQSKEQYSFGVRPKELTIQSDRIAKFTVIYTPLKRGINLAEKVWLEGEDERKLAVVAEGRGVGAELRLDRDMIPFGLTVLGCSNTVKLALINSGDFGARFMWDLSKALDCFKISPKDGYSTPGSLLTFDVTFTPKGNTPTSVRNQVSCIIENAKSPLNLILSGTSGEIPPPRDLVKFSCPVRQSSIKSVPIYNHTTEKWVIYPTLSGDFFSGETLVTVPARTTVNYEVTYAPMNIAKKKNNHEGSVLFCLPDGQSLVYALKGQANPPENDEPVTWTTPAKKNFLGRLPITNWLPNQSQRFSVAIKGYGENMKTFNKNLYKIYGNAQIEVAASATRYYEIHFFSYLPATLDFLVTYTNEEEGEFGWVELSIVVTESEVLESFVLATEARSPVEVKVPFSNPTEVRQTLTCDPGDFQIFTNTPLVLQPKQNGELLVGYLPIFEEHEREAELVIRSSGMGEFLYRLVLTCLSPPLPPPVTLTASLGRSLSHSLTVTNHTPYDTLFKILVDSKSLICPKDVKVRARCSESFIILFEPFSETTESTLLTADSDRAGTFKFPLCLIGTSPVPKGPYEMRPGGNLVLMFKNIFHDTKEFSMISESELFTVKAPKKQIKAKQEGEFVIQMMKREELQKGDKIRWKEAVVASKLIVTPVEPSLSHLCWVYYIRANLS